MILEMKFGSSLACFWVPCRQKRDGPSGRRSAVLAQISQKCVFMFKLPAKMRWTVPYDSPTISQTSCIFCLRSARIASRTFAMFSGVVLVDGRPERSSSSTDVRPSLKRLYHKSVLLWFMALSPKVSCSIRWVSAAVFVKNETKPDADSLFFKIRHISCKKIAWSLKHNLTKTHWT